MRVVLNYLLYGYVDMSGSTSLSPKLHYNFLQNKVLSLEYLLPLALASESFTSEKLVFAAGGTSQDAVYGDFPREKAL